MMVKWRTETENQNYIAPVFAYQFLVQKLTLVVVQNLFSPLLSLSLRRRVLLVFGVLCLRFVSFYDGEK